MEKARPNYKRLAGILVIGGIMLVVFSYMLRGITQVTLADASAPQTQEITPGTIPAQQ